MVGIGGHSATRACAAYPSDRAHAVQESPKPSSDPTVKRVADDAAASTTQPDKQDPVTFEIEVVGPLPAGTKGAGIDLYSVTGIFRNATRSEQTVFAPNMDHMKGEGRAWLIHGYRFRGRKGPTYHYSVETFDRTGKVVPKAAFSNFVGGVSGRPEFKDVPYVEETDLHRIAPGKEARIHIGYVQVPRGTPGPIRVRATLRADSKEETDEVALRLIREAGRDPRVLVAEAQSKPEPPRKANETPNKNARAM
jgi:hypothetical protein